MVSSWSSPKLQTLWRYNLTPTVHEPYLKGWRQCCPDRHNYPVLLMSNLLLLPHAARQSSMPWSSKGTHHRPPPWLSKRLQGSTAHHPSTRHHRADPGAAGGTALWTYIPGSKPKARATSHMGCAHLSRATLLWLPPSFLEVRCISSEEK